ncbi:MFS transporter [Gordonia rhizosphera]|uniref:Putative drug resistance transporter n=1 Tax=Gordonia rhizosphera NBRC 16068 TaxID=1108045 RepID=K6VUR5_9ACTN|nr:MFS transporter [Gordonia rhizosphera]GAB90640.1 putative drug resistance transporter [Gordonia rhizosphera NBRC 16068]
MLNRVPEALDATVPARRPAPVFALSAAILGFFVVTLDAVIVNVALPSIRESLGGGMAGLQWVVDGYTLLFAALLLSSGSLADRIGARHALAVGFALFAVASFACGAAPTLPVLIGMRFVQGAAAALIVPASLTLVSETYPDPRRRSRAVGMWAMGGAVASTAGPVAGGLLTELNWRWIFLINVPVAVIALLALRRTAPSPTHPTRLDWPGQLAAVTAMAALTFAAIEAGDVGVLGGSVLVALLVAVIGLTAFVLIEARTKDPMVPLDLFGGRVFRISLIAGFAFMVGYFGLPFVMSLYFQQTQGMSAFQTGIAFLPMMLIGLVLTPFSARIVERVGARTPIVGGLACMVVGMVALVLAAPSAPNWALSILMVLVGLGGPLTMPPLTALLLHHVPPERTGTASGVFNTSRQIGGALAVAVFGALLADDSAFTDGLHISLLVGATVVAIAAIAGLRLPQR